MTSTITSAIATLFLIVGVWTVNLICYHPYADNFDPMSPINVTVSWK
jgi:hypothetical protein